MKKTNIGCYGCKKFDSSKHFTQDCQKRGGVCSYEGQNPLGTHYHDYYTPDIAVKDKKYIRGCGVNLTELKI